MTLEFRVLGPTEATRDGLPLDLGGPDPEAVLTRLVLDANAVVAASEFHTTPRAELPRLVQELQSVFGSSTIEVLDGGYRINVERGRVDASRFVAAATEGCALASAGRHGEALDRLEAALDEWRAPAPYMVTARHGLLRLDVMKSRMRAEMALLAEDIADLGRPSDAAERQSPAAAVGPHARAGVAPVAPAVATAMAPERQPDEPVGGPPTAPTAAVEGHPEAAPPDGDGETNGDVCGGALIGRHAELARLRGVLRRSGVALVTGPAGVGKRALVDEALGGAADAEGTVAWGHCRRRGAPALWPWLGVARRLLQASDPHGRREALWGDAEMIARAIEHAHLGGPAEADPASLARALRDFLLRVASRQRLVVVLYDLQWADVPSLALLHDLARQAPTVPLSVVGTCRDVSRTSEVGGWLAKVADAGEAETIRLGGIGPGDVARLVAAACGEWPNPMLVEALYRASQGNPLVAIELALLLQADGSLAGPPSPKADGALGEPIALPELVRQRVANLPTPAARLLRLAAITGEVFQLERLARAAGIDDNQAAGLIGVATEAGLLIAHPRIAGRCRFTHSPVAEALADAMPASHRDRILAEVGVRLGVSAVSAALAAADASVRRGQFEEARERLLLAFDSAQDIVDPGERDRVQMIVRRRIGALTVAAAGTPPPGKAGKALELLRAWDVALEHGQVATADEFARQLWEVSQRAGDDRSRMAGSLARGVTELQQGRPRAACAHLAEDAGLWEVRAEPLLADALHKHEGVVTTANSAWAWWLLGDSGEATRLSRQGGTLAKRAAHVPTLAYAVFAEACLLVFEGDAEAVDARAVHLHRIATSGALPAWRAIAAVLHGWADATRGVDEGVSLIERALRRLDATGQRNFRPLFLALLADGCRSVGKLEAAEAAAVDGLAELEAGGGRFYESELLRLHGEIALALAAARPAARLAAVHSLRRAVEVAQAQGATSLEKRSAQSLRRATA